MKVQSFLSQADEALACPTISAKLAELSEVLQAIPVPVYPAKSSKQRNKDLVQPMLNALIAHWLEELGWKTQTLVEKLAPSMDRDAGTLDFTHRLPNGRYIAVEVQFANGGRLERDFYKFGQLHSKGMLALGVVVYLDRKTANTADSGLAMFETAVSRKGAHGDMPLCLIGLGREGEQEVDLSVLNDVVFPTVLGGSGAGSEPVRAFVAAAIVNDEDLREIRFPRHLVQIVRAEAFAHLDKNIAALEADIERVIQCKNIQTREVLLGRLAQFFRSSYNVNGLQRLLQKQAILQAKLDLGLGEGAGVALVKPEGAPTLACTARAVQAASDPREPVVLRRPSEASSSSSPTSQARYRVPRALAVASSSTPKRFDSTAREPRYPVNHFAMAGAFARAFRATTLTASL